jgi:hypothetical protein
MPPFRNALLAAKVKPPEVNAVLGNLLAVSTLNRVLMLRTASGLPLELRGKIFTTNALDHFGKSAERLIVSVLL